MRATNAIPLGCSRLLPVGTVNCAQTLKATMLMGPFWDSTSTVAGSEYSTVRVFRQKITLEDAIGSHACSLEALSCV
jgi:hypothetical protein